jgi:hypothetical protein
VEDPRRKGVFCASYQTLDAREKLSKSASRRSGGIAVLWRRHAIDARRLQERRSWVVSFSILRPFGPTSSLLDLA